MDRKLLHVIADIGGETGQKTVAAILAGERKPQVPATLRSCTASADHRGIPDRTALARGRRHRAACLRGCCRRLRRDGPRRGNLAWSMRQAMPTASKRAGADWGPSNLKLTAMLPRIATARTTNVQAHRADIDHGSGR